MALDIINMVCTTARVILDGAELVVQTDKCIRDPSALGVTGVATRVFIVLAQAAQGAAIVGGAPISAREVINVCEMVGRVVITPVRIAELAEAGASAGAIFEQGIVGSMASVFRVASEQNRLQCERRLQMSDEELAKEKDFIYETQGDDIVLVGTKSVTREECVQAHEVAENTKIISSVVEVATRAGLVSATCQTMADFAEPLIRRLMRAHQGPVNPPRPINPQRAQVMLNAQRAAAAAVQGNFLAQTALVDDPFNLVAYDRIPDELAGDPVFNRYICLIGHCPLRDPVGDPTAAGRVLYERSEIEQWLRQHTTSPATRLPLTVATLVEKPMLKQLIDIRLQEYETVLRQIVSRYVLRRPPAIPVVAQAATDVENPAL